MNESRLRPPGIRQTVTIYTRWLNQGANLWKPFRRVLHNVFMAEEGNTIARQTGIVLNQSFFYQCFLEHGIEYVPLHVWLELSEPELAGKWSADFVSPASIIVDHEVDHEFNFMSSGQLTIAENTFVNNTPGASRIAKIEPNDRGTQRARHILIRA